MLATHCAYCNSFSGMRFLSAGPALKLAENSARAQATFSCTTCGRLSVGSVFTTPGQAGYSLNEGWWTDKTPTWIPELVGGKEFADVPQHIAPAADEAHQCRSIQALRASILLARAVIEATCKDNGVIKGLLASKIDAMAEKGLIRPHTQDAAHELRFLGNDMAHGDFVDAIDEDDADAVLDVMDEILNEVYQGPARVQRMKDKRAAKKQDPQAALPAVPSRSGGEFP